MTNRSEAANKAWATRRANARKAEYSARAQKAWATRRSNEAATPTVAADAASTRRQAALKAWETRRANAETDDEPASVSILIPAIQAGKSGIALSPEYVGFFAGMPVS
jgi:hypothetical protein